MTAAERRAADLDDRLTFRGRYIQLTTRDILIERLRQLVALRDAHLAGREPQSVLAEIALVEAQLQ